MQLLEGIKVLDLSRILAGPWATQLLADYGAEVIKVEKPINGDDTRHWGPPFIEPSGCESQESAYFISANRNKYSVALDFRTVEGQAILRKMVSSVDVVVENFKVGGLKQYGLDYESLKKINPNLIYCSITGFGQTGPMANQAGYDAMIQAFGGLMSITGEPADEGGQPQKVGVAVVDLATGLYASNAIIASLYRREKSGKGAYIDMALLDAQVSMLANQASNFLVTGHSPERMGSRHPNIVPYQVFDTADQPIYLAIGNDEQFAVFSRALKQNWHQQAAFKTNRQRVANRAELCSKITLELIKSTAQDWLYILGDLNLPVTLVQSIEEVFSHPQVVAREQQVEVKDAFGRRIPSVLPPGTISDHDYGKPLPPPVLGQHSVSVLENFGFSKSQIQVWLSEGIVQSNNVI